MLLSLRAHAIVLFLNSLAFLQSDNKVAFVIHSSELLFFALRKLYFACHPIEVNLLDLTQEEKHVVF